jgi:uncharacterized membrane protein
MKKILILFVGIVLSILSFFYYEQSAFHQYVNTIHQNHVMLIPINQHAPVKSSNEIEIKAPIDIVWLTLTDIEHWTQWQKAVTETIVRDNIEAGTTFQWKADGLTFQSTIHTSKPYTAFGWTGTTIGASAVHNWTFTEKDSNTTRIIVEESLQGVFPKVFRKYFQENLDQGVLTNLQELKDASELKFKSLSIN